jgi:hypothetical protein
MARKIIALNEEVKKAQEKLAEIERLKIEAEKEETILLESVTNQINELQTTNNVFVGMTITRQDLLAIVDIALQSGENVKVPFRVYIND